MNKSKYEAFLKVVELGSFTKAADQLGYTQSAISQLISSVESELDIKLLNRSRSGIELTSEGRELLPFFEGICKSCDELSDRARSINNIDSGMIKAGVVTVVCYNWLPDLMSKFRNKYPNVKYELTGGTTDELLDLVTNGDLDFAIVTDYKSDELFHLTLRKLSLAMVGKGDKNIGCYGCYNCSDVDLRTPDFLMTLAMASKGLGKAILPADFIDLIGITDSNDINVTDIDVNVDLVMKNINTMSRTSKCFLDLMVED